MLEIRRLEAADLPQVAALQAASPEAAQWNPPDYFAFETWVACDGESVAGFIALRETAPGESEVLNLAVHPASRRRGIARALLARALAGRSGDVYLEVRESNAAAIAFYASSGFVTAGRRPKYYQNPPETGIVMKVQKW